MSLFLYEYLFNLYIMLCTNYQVALKSKMTTSVISLIEQLKAMQTKWVKYTLGWNFFILPKETSDDSLVK